MAEGNWSVIRVEKISAEGAQKTERHNERKNESYANLNVDTEQIARNVHFKDTGGLTYNEYFQRLIDEGKISTRIWAKYDTAYPQMIIAKSSDEALRILDETIAEMEDMGLSMLEEYWTNQFMLNIEKFGWPENLPVPANLTLPE